MTGSTVWRRRAARALAVALGVTLPAVHALAWCEDAGSSMVELKDCLYRVQQDVERELILAAVAAQRDVAARDFLDPTLRARYAVAFDRSQAAFEAWLQVDCFEVTGFEWWSGSGAGAAIRECYIGHRAARVRDLTERYRLDATDYPVSHAGQ